MPRKYHLPSSIDLGRTEPGKQTMTAARLRALLTAAGLRVQIDDAFGGHRYQVFRGPDLVADGWINGSRAKALGEAVDHVRESGELFVRRAS